MPKKIERLADITPDSRNANKGTERGNYQLEESLRRYGAGRSILVDKHGVAIAGNKTLEAAADLGLTVRVVETSGNELVVVQRNDLDLDADPKARELAYADNRVAQVSLEWDADQIAADVAAGIDLSAFWKDEELEALFQAVEPVAPPGDPDNVPEVPAEPITQVGDLIILGTHRLLCGDSASKADVERLMDGEQANIVWTDPPYGVDRAGGPKDPRDANHRSGGTIANDTLQPAELRLFLADALGNACDAWRPGAVWYVAAPAQPLHLQFASVLYELEIWRQTIMWVKDTFVLGRSDYHYRHEPIFYGWKPGAAHHAVADRTLDSVWEVPRPTRSPEHPTMKPIELVERALKNSSVAGAVVLDPFGGSGTTLIAAEATGRKARLIELDPTYCDVIVRRWEEYTGKTAQRPTPQNPAESLHR